MNRRAVIASLRRHGKVGQTHQALTWRPRSRIACTLAALFACTALFGAPPQPASVSVGVGLLDIRHDGRAADFSADYRWHTDRRLQMRVLGTWSTDGSRFFGPGVLLHTPLTRRWTASIGFAGGYYEREHGPKLGSALEFVSTLEFSRAVLRDHRVGIAVEHISNGSIGDENPGAETIRLLWLTPLGW